MRLGVRVVYARIATLISNGELVSAHLVWSEDCDDRGGYDAVSRTPDLYAAIVCASLFCQKSVMLRRDRLDLRRSGRSKDDEEEDKDQESALILAVETVLQARRSFTPSFRYFMWGMGLVARLVEIGDYRERCGPISVDESKIVLEALYPEGIGEESEDYFLLCQWVKRILRGSVGVPLRPEKSHEGV